MYVEKHTVAIETDASGDAVAYTPNVTGRIHAIIYQKDDFADGVDFTITLESTGESLWTDTNVNAAEKVYPVVAANLGADGAASTILQVPILAADDRVKIVVAQGGNAKAGTFQVIVS